MTLPLDDLPLLMGVMPLAALAVFGWSRRPRRPASTPSSRLAVVEALPDALVLVDGAGDVIELNSAAARLLQTGIADLIGQPVERVLGGQPDMLAAYRSVDSAAEGALCEAVDGRTFMLRRVPVPNNIIAGRACLLVAREERDQWEERTARRNDPPTRMLDEQTADVVAIITPEGVIIHASQNFARLLAHPASALSGQPLGALTHPDDEASLDKARARLAAHPGEGAWAELRLRHADGSWRLVEATMSDRLADPAISGIVVAMRDITTLRQLEEQLHHQERHDPLTGLANLRHFRARAQQALSAAQASRAPLVVLTLDLAGVTEVNQRHGHHVGDLLLQAGAARLAEAMPEAVVIGRLSGASFGILLGDAQEGDARRATERLRQIFAAPLLADAVAVQASARVGFALCPDHGDDIETLLGRAEIARFAAAGAPQSQPPYTLSPPEDGQAPMAERLALATDLRRALEGDELRLHFQPIIDARTARLARLEALVRWEHPRHGLVPPGYIIPLAEQTDLIPSLTRWVLRAALGQQRLWRATGLDVAVAVNLTARDLTDLDLPDMLAEALLETEPLPTALVVEATEDALMTDDHAVPEVLRRLRALGVAVAIDNFGRGALPLVDLGALPVDEIKLDRAFVGRATQDERQSHILRAMIELGHAAGLAVVVEGVEEHAAWNLLTRLNADLAQGHYLCEPVPTQEPAQFVADIRAGLLGQRPSTVAPRSRPSAL